MEGCEINKQYVKINGEEGDDHGVKGGREDLVLASPAAKPYIASVSGEGTLCENRDRKGGYLVS
uniref:Uncharacterized protein n=1 Tax=viral metagenome TaxID=1070528 RepID=A0A6M3M6N0_9ZZZZ